MQKRAHCDRCRRFTYNLDPVVIRVGFVQRLCTVCQAIVREKLERHEREKKGGVFEGVLQYVEDIIVDGANFIIHSKKKVILIRPWARIEELNGNSDKEEKSFLD